MFPGGRVNPRQMKAMMRRMGISTEELDGVEEIVIRTRTKEYIFKDAMVSVMTVQGQKTFQIVGEPEINERKDVAPQPTGSSREDIALVMEQTGASEEEAKKALEECGGQPAEAILKIMSSR